VRHRVALTITFWFVVLACCACAFALDPSLDISQYAHTSWKVRDGFAKGAISTIAQTPDGYLWLGTEFGLLRFDGVRAVPWQPPNGEQLPSNHVFGLLVARDGTLWIGTRKGLASWKDGKLTQYGEVAGVQINRFREDRDGTVWFGVYGPPKARFCAIRAGRVECYGEGIFGDGVFALYRDREGNLWVTDPTGLWRWLPGPPTRYAFPRGVNEANDLTEDDAGTLLLATNDGLKQLVDGKIQNYPVPGISGQFRPSHFFRSSDGSLWIGTHQGLLRLHHGRVDGFRASDGLSGDHVAGIFQDREGSLWVASGEGLDRFREYPIPTISRNQGLAGSEAWSVQAAPDGAIWVGTGDGINRWVNGHVTVYRGRSALGQTHPRDETEPKVGVNATEIAKSGLRGGPESLGLDGAGRLWASTNEGVFYFEQGKFVRLPGIPGGIIPSIAGDGHGNVWILHAAAGLFRWSPDAPVQQISPSQIGQKLARTILPDKESGGVWLEFVEGGVAYLKDGKTVRSYDPADGLGSGVVDQLRFGSRGGLWAATEGGLSRINIRDGHINDGPIETLSSKNGLPCDTVHWSMEDDDHNIWVYMPCGLARIDAAEWYAWVDDPKHVVKTIIFDTSDGVRSVAVYGAFSPRVTKSADGRIWFLPKDGVSVIDPRRLVVNKLPPPVQIEQITVDRKTYDAVPGLRLPPHVRNLAIDYTALSLVAPEKIHFRYKLEGQDPDWREVVNDREVQYSNLGPRHYTFRVMASNNSGVWNEAGASLEFSVLPAFYQTIWFRLLCAVGFMAVLWGIYQLRIRELRRQFNIGLEARVNERTRIARELHDTLLQNFQGVLLKFHAVSYMLGDRPEAQKTLATVIDQARQAITEGRDAVQGLRSSALAGNDLARAIRMLGEELTSHETGNHGPGNRGPAFSVQVEGTPRDLAPILRDDVYRIAGELIRNAFRHAEAGRIEVELWYDQRQFRLRIRDDGKGIDPKILNAGARAGHYGLPGMHERAKLVGGKLTLWSEVDAGTEAELTIPAAIAYAKSAGTPPAAHLQTGT
jgi:signal transduction histidine kinase/ligand-binding sensor domain-containing protein